MKSSREVVEGLIDTLTPFMSRVNDADKELHREINIISTLLESYQHLGDVDAIWSDVEGHKTNLLGLHEKLDAFIKETHSEQERIVGLIHQIKEDNYHAHLQYNKKNKIAFWIGGGAVGLTVINIILQIIGIL